MPPQPGSGRVAIQDLVTLIEQLGVIVRREPLGTGGGMCIIKGQRVCFVDELSDLATQRTACLSSLAQLPEFDNVYVRPDIRAAVEAIRTAGSL